MHFFFCEESIHFFKLEKYLKVCVCGELCRSVTKNILLKTGSTLKSMQFYEHCLHFKGCHPVSVNAGTPSSSSCEAVK